jgi:uncharacterized protein (TIGR02646 family)
VKRVQKSQPEPECLRDYRTQNPHGTWDEFKDESQACYSGQRGILQTLVQDQSGVCAYCEATVTNSDRQVAHFHPKSDSTTAKNWHLDWDNLWLACKGGTNAMLAAETSRFLPPVKDNRSCDEATESRVIDEQVIHPHDIPAFPRIFRFHTSADCVEIRVDEENCGVAAIDIGKAEMNVTVFNLNCRRLTAARMEAFAEIERQVKRLRTRPDRTEKLQMLARAQLAKRDDGTWPAYFTMIRWRFGKLAEDYLHSINFQG